MQIFFYRANCLGSFLLIPLFKNSLMKSKISSGNRCTFCINNVQTSGLGCVNKNSLTSGDCLENRELKYSKLYFFILLQQYIHISASLLRTYCLIYKLHKIINKYGSNHNFINFIQNIILTSSTT
jgi:hypothetical protein